MTDSGSPVTTPGSPESPAGPVVIAIYDPPMCCPGGLCGPAVDPALLDISEACLTIEKEFGGSVQVKRYLLSQQAAEFMRNPRVLELLRQQGTEVLPVTTVNGVVVKERAYPSLAELRGFLDDPGLWSGDGGAGAREGRAGVDRRRGQKESQT